ncbi:hypothetical protein [Eubacterium sp. 1001713B170207_170306_E7]|uniref:hypothetical protein n=1 Tax=Eubacterium sp. 1001713B170207_170306_E7 TaxID=2787097 RepID=UPI00189AAD75|nr:hypothetical protein [Eubacterium sp. 1001713B170207_170306_E7]
MKKKLKICFLCLSVVLLLLFLSFVLLSWGVLSQINSDTSITKEIENEKKNIKTNPKTSSDIYIESYNELYAATENYTSWEPIDSSNSQTVYENILNVSGIKSTIVTLSDNDGLYLNDEGEKEKIVIFHITYKGLAKFEDDRTEYIENVVRYLIEPVMPQYQDEKLKVLIENAQQNTLLIDKVEGISYTPDVCTANEIQFSIMLRIDQSVNNY